jgi:hypothetical protein
MTPRKTRGLRVSWGESIPTDVEAGSLFLKLLDVYSDKQEAGYNHQGQIRETSKMVSTVKSATQTQPAAQPPAVQQKSTQPKPQRTTKTDTVHISNAGLAAVQEATETHAQTVNEASHGDSQAQRLLAKEAAAKAAAK